MDHLEAYIQRWDLHSKRAFALWMISGALFIGLAILSQEIADWSGWLRGNREIVQAGDLRGYTFCVGLGFLVAGFFFIHSRLISDTNNRIEGFCTRKKDPRKPECEDPPPMLGMGQTTAQDASSTWQVFIRSRLFLTAAAGLLFYVLAYFPAIYATKLATFKVPLPVPRWLYFLYAITGGAITIRYFWRATNLLYPGLFGLHEGILYAGQVLRYAKQPLDMAEYLTDLDPWTGEPFPGTKSAWRMDVYRGHYPDQVDSEGFCSIMEELQRPDSVYSRWWESTSVTVREKAEKLDGAMRKCFECAGVGKYHEDVECERCKGEGKLKIFDGRHFDHEEVVDLSDRTMYVSHYRYDYRYIICPCCNGSKKVHRVTLCKACYGLGQIPFSKRDTFYVELRNELLKEARAFVEQTKGSTASSVQ
jgi:hypothetical protein